MRAQERTTKKKRQKLQRLAYLGAMQGGVGNCPYCSSYLGASEPVLAPVSRAEGGISCQLKAMSELQISYREISRNAFKFPMDAEST